MDTLLAEESTCLGRCWAGGHPAGPRATSWTWQRGVWMLTSRRRRTLPTTSPRRCQPLAHTPSRWSARGQASFPLACSSAWWSRAARTQWSSSAALAQPWQAWSEPEQVSTGRVLLSSTRRLAACQAKLVQGFGPSKSGRLSHMCLVHGILAEQGTSGGQLPHEVQVTIRRKLDLRHARLLQARQHSAGWSSHDYTHGASSRHRRAVGDTPGTVLI